MFYKKKSATCTGSDNYYTAPVYGFKNAADYYTQSSCKKYIEMITIPTLIINSKDDPFLNDACFPIDEAKNSKNVYLEITNAGGHCGFITFNKENEYWHESRICFFIDD